MNPLFLMAYTLPTTGKPWLDELMIKAAAAALLILPFLNAVAIVAIWGERKVAGRIQSRHGPMRVGGWHGWLQSFADGIKLLGKEDLIPQNADTLLFRLAPYLAFAPSFAAFLFLAWSRDLSGLTGTFNVGVFFILAVLGIEVLGVILAGWASNNKWSIYGAMREACQMVSYEIPLGFSIICAAMVAGSLNMFDISLEQSGGFHKWLIFHDPFNFIAFIVYYIAALASCKRAPFDLPESESELVAGFHTEYSGMRWALFFFAEYGAMFVVSGIQTSLWLGAWYDPFGLIAHLETLRFNADGSIHWSHMIAANVLGAACFIFKASLLVYLQMWLRWTLPRLRIDQVLYMCVKVLLPVACLNLLGASVYLWLIDPALPNGGVNPTLVVFQQVVQIGLAVVGILLLALMAAVVVWAWTTRSKNTFKVIFPNSTTIETLPGA